MCKKWGEISDNVILNGSITINDSQINNDNPVTWILGNTDRERSCGKTILPKNIYQEGYYAVMDGDKIIIQKLEGPSEYIEFPAISTCIADYGKDWIHSDIVHI